MNINKKSFIMKYLKILVFLVIVMLSIESYAQIGVTIYSKNSFAINTSQNKKISGEFKTFANCDFEELLMEFDVFYNFKPGKHHRFSLGMGINGTPFQGFDYFQALTIPVSIEIYPLKEFRKISILFEFAPVIIFEDNPYLRNLLGIRYSFGE